MAVIEMQDVQPGQTIAGQLVEIGTRDERIKPYRKPTRVQKVEPCAGRWRTHVHVNGLGCWDGRTVVEVQ